MLTTDQEAMPEGVRLMLERVNAESMALSRRVSLSGADASDHLEMGAYALALSTLGQLSETISYVMGTMSTDTVCIVDGSMFSPSSRALPHGGEAWLIAEGHPDYWEMWDGIVDDAIRGFSHDVDGSTVSYSLSWEDGALYLERDIRCPSCGRPVHDHGRPTITTNNVPRDILDAYELAPAERADFDYLDWSAIERGEDSASFFRYRGQLYDLGEFERWDNPASPTRLGWDGFRSDSYFSGIVVRYVDDCERIVVGTVLS